ncbi:hypothetical protein AVEN_94500-1 [Araneus ventricosus]|uniref:Uncharacterized protein n=1 Tax=Araneus ventricosus TaxID=182803 RepID=A0A4Y2PWU4_ARAVE|nr:hypothetical protein AVEN_94500-1 [Araneus ventricosus]
MRLQTTLTHGMSVHLKQCCRLLGSHMHNRSHAVMRLPVHLPNQKRVTFKDGHEEEALEAARSRQTMLESWFQLNQSDPDAQTLLNTDIPYNYVRYHIEAASWI